MTRTITRLTSASKQNRDDYVSGAALESGKLPELLSDGRRTF